MRVFLKMTRLQFKMVLRNKGVMVSSIGLAVISMLVFGTVFGGDGSQPIGMGLVDLDKSVVSTQLTAALKNNPSLRVTESDQVGQLVDDLKNGKQAAVVVLEPGFGAKLGQAEAKVQLYIDTSDLIGAARSRGTVSAIFDSVSKQAAGFKDLIQVEEQSITVRQQRQIDLLTPGMLGMTLMFANMPIGIFLIGWRERGTLKRLSATPLKAWQLIGSQIVSQLALSFVQAAVILLIAVNLFEVRMEASWLGAISVFVVAGSFSLISLGYAIGNFVKKQQAGQSLVMMVSLPMMLLGGSYFVVEPPSFLKPLVEILPLTHLNRAFRQIMLNGATLDSLWLNLCVLLTFGIVLLVLSIRTFQWSK
ncbi:MAG: ABC transporter permease [Chloroflexi bacterium]|nr:ABC transporter permease [Chloroflexota bacterium]